MKRLKKEKELVTKAFAYRIYQSFLVSPFLLYLMTGNLTLALSFGIAEFTVKLLSYYLFEKIWKVVKKC